MELNRINRDTTQFRMRVEEQGSTVNIIRETPASGYVMHTDRNRLAQVIANFMTNALKFTTSGSITLGYKINKDNLYFYVSDTGTGIPEEKVGQIFNRFVKLQQEKSGTGLGLSICMTIIEKLGGEIGGRF